MLCRCHIIIRRGFRIFAQLRDAQVKMPALSPTMTTGTIVKWNKKEGDSLAPGDVLCEVQTDKAIVALETDDEGILAKILVQENVPDVEVGRLIALVVDEGKDWKNVPIPADVKVEASAPSSSPAAPAPAQTKSASAEFTPHDRIVGPATRLLLQTYQISANDVQKTSHPRALLKNDVLKYVSDHKLTPKVGAESQAAPGDHQAHKTGVGAKPVKDLKAKTKGAARTGRFVDIQVSKDKKEKAEQLIASKFYTPHAYNRITISMDDIADAIEHVKKDDLTLSYADFALKACAAALREIPEANVYFDGEKITMSHTIDCAMYFENDSESFLTPVVRSVDRLPVTQISDYLKALSYYIQSKEHNKLDFGQAPFGFCDGSSVELREFTSILKAPQTAVLCFGHVYEEINQDLKPTRRCVATLAYDNRAISDDTASAFLQSLRANLTDYSRMIIGPTRPLSMNISLP